MAMLLALALLILAHVPAVASAVGYACFVLLLLASLETRTLKLNSKAEGLKPERKLWSLNLHPKTKPSNPKSYTARLQPGNAGHGDHTNCTRQLPYPHRGPFLGFRAQGSQFVNGFVVILPSGYIVNPRKLEHRFRMIHAGIPFSLL